MIARDIIRFCSPAQAHQQPSAHRWARHASAIAVVLALCASPSAVAHAETKALPRLDWPEELSSGSDCGDYAQLAQRVEAQLGRPRSEAELAFTFSVRIERTSAGYRLSLVTEHGAAQGERTFEGASCREVTDAAVLLIALSLDGSKAHADAAGSAEARPDSIRGTAPLARDARAPDAIVPSAARARSRTRWGLRAGGLLEVGTLPRPAVGFELGISLAWARSRFELSGLGLPGVRSERAALDGSRVEVRLGALRLQYCQRLLGTRTSIGACLGGELGLVSGDGLDLAGRKETDYVWGAGWAALRVAVALSEWLGLSLEPALAVPVARRRFVSSDADGAAAAVLHTPALLTMRLSLALEAHF